MSRRCLYDKNSRPVEVTGHIFSVTKSVLYGALLVIVNTCLPLKTGHMTHFYLKICDMTHFYLKNGAIYIDLWRLKNNY